MCAPRIEFNYLNLELMGKWCLIFLVFLTGCEDAAVTKPVVADPSPVVVSVHADSTDHSTDWNYDSSVDEMTSKRNYFASIDAKELLQFGFPYNGGSVATLTVRKMSGRSAVILQVSSGQFMTGVDGEVVKARFDDGPPVEFEASSSNDDDPKVLFVDDAVTFIAKVKKAKVTRIQATFFNEGAPVMEFETAGLAWHH